MSYRFKNRGEKSDLQRAYEYINQQPIGTDFNVHTIMDEVGLPQNTASAALAFLSANGMMEKQKEKIRIKGTSNPVSVYRFVKKIDKREHSKPIEHKRTIIKRTVKPAAAPNRDVPIIGTATLDLEKLKRITDALFNCCVELEIYMTEIKEARDGKISTSVRPAPELPVWNGSPQKDRQ